MVWLTRKFYPLLLYVKSRVSSKCPKLPGYPGALQGLATPVIVACLVTTAGTENLQAETKTSRGETHAANESGKPLQLPKVTSINLCTDQLMLELADPEQILSLTNLSQDPAASVHVKKAKQYPINTGIVEEILPQQPDFVLAGPFTSRYTLQLLQAVGIRVETVSIANSMEDVITNIENVAGWLGQEERGQQMTDAIRQGLATLPKPPHPWPRAAIYDPRGYTAGRASLRGEMLELTGWQNVASEKGIESYGTLSLETILKLEPDVLVKSPFSADTWSRAQAQNSHPALRKRGLKAPVITIHSSQTICGGPWSMAVIHQLQDARLKLFKAAQQQGLTN